MSFNHSYINAVNMRWMSGLTWMVALSFVLGGCAQKERVKADAAPVVWSWDTYPTSVNLPIARVDARVQAELSTRFYSPGNGRLKVFVSRASVALEQGQIWATFSPESLQLGQDMLEARRSALVIRKQTLNEVDLPQKRMEVEKRLREMLRLQEITKRLGDDEAVWKSLAELMPDAGLAEADRSPAVIDRTVRILTQQLAFLSGDKGADASQDLQIAEVELRQSEIDLQLKRSQYEMRMPFSGELVCNLDLRDGLDEYPVMSGQLIGIARKDNSLNCEVRMQDGRWLSLPADALFLKIKTSDGGDWELPYSGRRIRDEMRSEVLNYVFKMPSLAVPKLRNNVDSMMTAELVMRLVNPVRIVPKVSLINAYPAAFAAADWSGGVSATWPGARVVAVGTSVVAIDPQVVVGE